MPLHTLKKTKDKEHAPLRIATTSVLLIVCGGYSNTREKPEQGSNDKGSLAEYSST